MHTLAQRGVEKYLGQPGRERGTLANRCICCQLQKLRRFISGAKYTVRTSFPGHSQNIANIHRKDICRHFLEKTATHALSGGMTR